MPNYVRQSRLRILGEAMMGAANGLVEAKIAIHQAKSAEEKEAAKTIAEARKIDLMEAENLLRERALDQSEEQHESTEDKAKAEQQVLDDKVKQWETKYGKPMPDHLYNQIQFGLAGQTDPLAEANARREEAERRVNARYEREGKMGDGSPLGENQQGPSVPKPFDANQWELDVENEERKIALKDPITPPAKSQDQITEDTDTNQLINVLQEAGEWTQQDTDSGVDPNQRVAEIFADTENPDRAKRYRERAIAKGVEEPIPESESEKVIAGAKAQVVAAKAFAEAYNLDRLESEHIDEIEAGAMRGYWTSRDKSDVEVFWENAESAERIRDQYFKDANLTPAQFAELVMTGKFSDSSEGAFEGLVRFFEKDIAENPTRYGDNPNPAALAFAAQGRAKDWKTQMAAENADRFFKDTSVITDEHRKKYPNQNDSQILDIMETAAIDAVTRVATTKTGSVASRFGDNHRLVQERAMSIMNSDHPPELKLYLLTETLMQDSYASSGATEAREAFDGRQEIAAGIMAAEELFLAISQEGPVGNRRDILDRANRILGKQYDADVTEVNQLVLSIIEEHRLRVTGKAFRAGEQQELLRRMPSFGNNMETNLALIRGWLGTVNTLNEGAFRSRLGSPFGEIAPDWYVLGSMQDEVEVDEDGQRRQKYKPSHRISDPEVSQLVKAGYARQAEEGKEEEVTDEGQEGTEAPSSEEETIEESVEEETIEESKVELPTTDEIVNGIREATDGTPEDTIAAIGMVNDLLPEEGRVETIGQIAEQLMADMDEQTRLTFLESAKAWLESLDIPDEQKQAIWERLNKLGEEE